MRIPVKLIVEVDPAEWAATYGIGPADGRPGGRTLQAAVREDIRNYILNLVQCSAGVDESAAEVTLA